MKFRIYNLLKYVTIFLFMVCIFFTTINTYSFSSDISSLTLEVKTDLCELNINIAPEHRWTSLSKPDYGDNLSTIIKMEIINTSGVSMGLVENIRTDVNGLATIDICKEKIQMVQNEKYSFYIKGLSNLRKYYPNFTVQLGISGKNDFTFGKTSELLNGETSVIDDDFINALDIATVVSSKYYSVVDETDSKIDFEQKDLNRDRIVNSLDLSNILTNYGKEGFYCATCRLRISDNVYNSNRAK